MTRQREYFLDALRGSAAGSAATRSGGTVVAIGWAGRWSRTGDTGSTVHRAMGSIVYDGTAGIGLFWRDWHWHHRAIPSSVDTATGRWHRP